MSYKDFVPPCGVYCGSCYMYTREKNRCEGAGVKCLRRRCKTIYVCCIEKRNLSYCGECEIFPCIKFKKFAGSWRELGQDLIENQNVIRSEGAKAFLDKMNDKK